MGTKRTATVELGALSPAISEQLVGRIGSDDAQRLDVINDAINLLYVSGFIAQAATDRARKKLLKKCQEAVTKHAASTENSREAGK